MPAAVGRWRKAARLLPALLVVLAGGELLVRLLIMGPSTHVFDADIGYTYQPQSELFQTKEGFTRLRFNSLGLNDAELAAKGGRCRVLVIGDSYTAALQVRQSENFTSAAEQLNQQLDVVNAGRDGLFLGDLHKVYRRLASDVQPDLVVYVVSQRAVETDIHLSDFAVVVDPKTGAVVDAVMRVEDKEGVKAAFEPLLHKSALATRLSGQLQPMVLDAMAQVRKLRAWLSPRAGQAQRPVAEPAARASDEDVLSFVFRRLSGPTPTALMYLDALRYQPGRRATVADTSAKAEAVARRAAERAGVPFFSTGEYLVASVASTGQPPYGFDNALLPGGHLNVYGHRAIGHALVDLIRAMQSTLPRQCAQP